MTLRNTGVGNRATHVNRKCPFFNFRMVVLSNIFGQMVSAIVKTLRNTNLVASRCFKMKKTSFPVETCHSKAPLLKLPSREECGILYRTAAGDRAY